MSDNLSMENNDEKSKDKKSPPTPPDVPDEKNAPVKEPEPSKKIITKD